MHIPDRIRQAHYLLIDSRKLLSASQTVFFAIQGQYLDGRDFIPDLYEKGVRLFVGRNIKTLQPQCSGAFFWEVEDPTAALQALAAHHRRRFEYPVLGITGSNAKTIVKEWLFQLLEGHRRMVKSPKSYNSQLGVPLSVWEMDHSHELGIFEAGVSKRGEMAKLAEILQPTLGIFTNIGPAHREGFQSPTHKVEEKLRLFHQVERLVYCYDHIAIREKVLEKSIPSFAWGKSPEADLQIVRQEESQGNTHIELRIQGSENLGLTSSHLSFYLPFTDIASVENALHCIAIALWLKIEPHILRQGLPHLRNLPMRLALKEGQKQSIIIDDTYNNDFSGLSAALAFLNQQEAQLPRVAILSDFLEAGDSSKRYQEVLNLLEEQHIQRLIAVGELWQQYLPGLRTRIHTLAFPQTSELLQELPSLSFTRSAILVKGARPFALEQVVERLQRQVHETRLEINLDALAHNFRFYKSLLPTDIKVMAMVKAFAYGSGGYEVASLLQYHRADYLAVAYTDEGVALRERGITMPIMVLNPSEEFFPLMMEYRLEPEIYSFRLLKAFLDNAEDVSQAPAIHLKLNTGMNRLGFDEQDLPKLLDWLRKHPSLHIVSAFTHLAAADMQEEEEFTQEQLNQYQRMAEQLSQVVEQPYLRHALNSPGITRFPGHAMDMIRLGIGLYGVDTNNFYQGNLHTVGTLKTYISQIRKVPKGSTIGYSRKGVVDRDSRIGVMAIGYADGYDRGFSCGVGQVYVNGHYAPVMGNVCMDMSMIDLTGIPAEEGDEVIVFGEPQPIQDLARAINTIPYEILTNVGQRVKRVFFVN